MFFGLFCRSSGIDNSLHTRVEFDSGHFYKYYNDGVGLKYEDARQRCLDDGGYLVVLNSEHENDFIHAMLANLELKYLNDQTGIVLIGMYWDDVGSCQTPHDDGSCDWSLQWVPEGLTSTGWLDWQQNVTFDTIVQAPSPPEKAVVFHLHHPTTWRIITIRVRLPFICEFESACVDAINPCGTGICTTLDGIDYSCACDIRYYTGTRCETELNACDSNPCVRGVCVQKPLYKMQCDCPESGYEGKYKL